MIDIPERVKQVFLNDNRSPASKRKYKLIFYGEEIDALYPSETLFPDESLFPSEHDTPWLVIENDRIVSESLQISEGISSGNDLEWGSCEKSEVQIVVADVAEDVTDKEFTLTVEVEGYEMILGIYKVSSYVRQADRRRRKITAYDRMEKFDTDVSDWYNSLNFPMPLKTFRDSLFDYTGISQDYTSLPLDSMNIERTIEPKEISGHDIIKSICQINGRFGRMNKVGKFQYVKLPETGLYPSETLYPEDELHPTEAGGDGLSVQIIETYKQGMSYEDYVVEGITGLTIRGEEGDVGASIGNGDNPYVIEGNFLVYGKNSAELLNISQSIFPSIEARSYRPVKIECSFMPWIEPGDAIRIITKDDVVESIVMKRTTKGCQASTDSLESSGSKRRKEDFGLNKQIIQLEGKTAVIIKTVDEVSVRVTDLKNYTESQFKVTSDAITAEVKRATNAEGELSGKISVNAKEIALKVSKGEVSSQLSVESDKVTITGNRLIVDSKNFKLDGEGNATFSGMLNSAGGIFNGDVSVTGFSESKYPIKLQNNVQAYFGIGGTGYLLAKSGYYIKLDYDQVASMPRLYGGSYTGIDGQSFEVTGIDNHLYLDADGMFKSDWVRRNKTGDEANIHISSEGYFYRVSSSSRRYKTDETTDLGEMNPDKLYDLPVKLFRYKDGYLSPRDAGVGKMFLGFIAEDMEEIFPCAVQYENGVPETWRERIMIPAMLKLIQEQNERIKRLEEL